MKFAFKSIVAAAAFVAAGVASAANVTVPSGTGVFNGLTATGSGALTFSQSLKDALDVGQIEITGYGAATPNITKDADGFYVNASVSAPITSLTINDANGTVLSAQTSGGATQTAPVVKKVSTGGSLTVTDLNVDIANKKVYVTLIGGNGVGTLNNFYLWDIASVTGATSVTGAGTFTTTLSGLSITANGLETFKNALGLLPTGYNALVGVTDYGSIVSNITATAAIPEPSTYALMGFGLLAMGAVTRRRRAQ